MATLLKLLYLRPIPVAALKALDSSNTEIVGS